MIYLAATVYLFGACWATWLLYDMIGDGEAVPLWLGCLVIAFWPIVAALAILTAVLAA